MRSKTEVRFHQIRFSLQARGPFPDAEQHLWGLRSHFYLIGYLDFLFSRGLCFLFFQRKFVSLKASTEDLNLLFYTEKFILSIYIAQFYKIPHNLEILIRVGVYKLNVEAL